MARRLVRLLLAAAAAAWASAAATPVAGAADGLAEPLDAMDSSLAAIKQAEEEHGIIVEHLTHQLLGLAGSTSSSTPAAERRNAALAAEPIFLQLEHAVRAHVDRVRRVSRSGAEASRSAAEAAGARAMLVKEKPTDESCFSCIYLMQKVLASTEPYNSPAVQAGTAASLSAEGRHIGTGARGIPVERPMESAYKSKNLPNNDPEPALGSPLLSPPTAMNGWASPTSTLLFHGPAGHPVTNPWAQFSSREDDAADEPEVAPQRRIPALDRELWPQLHEANSAEEESGEVRSGEDEADEGEGETDGDEEDGDQEDGDEEDGDPSLMQVGAAAATAGRRASPAAFLQAKAEARMRAGASATALTQLEQRNTAALSAPPKQGKDDIPAEAYMQYSEPPAIGPRIPPPIQEGAVPADEHIATFSKHYGAPLFSLDDRAGSYPPPLAPQALVRALEAGVPVAMPPRSVAGTYDGIGAASPPILTPRTDAKGAPVNNKDGFPDLVPADVESHMAIPLPRPDAALLQQRADAAPTDAASFLQAATRARAAPDSASLGLQGSFVSEVPDSVYFAYAHPPAIGPNRMPTLPRTPGAQLRPVWGDPAPGTPEAAAVAAARAGAGEAPSEGVSTAPVDPSDVAIRSMYSNEPMTPGVQAPSGIRGDLPIGDSPFPGRPFGDVYTKEMPVARMARDGPPIAMLQRSATRVSPFVESPASLPDARELGMGPTVAKVTHGPKGKDKPGPQAIPQMVRSPDLDIPAWGVNEALARGQPMMVKGDKLVPMTSLLQAGARGSEGGAEAQTIKPSGDEPGIPKDLAAGLYRPQSEAGKALDDEGRRSMHEAIDADRHHLGADPSSVGEGIEGRGEADGMTGPSANCGPDEVDEHGRRTGKGKCDDAGGLERVSSPAGEAEVFSKYEASRGRGDHNWPTEDGEPRHPMDRMPGVEPVQQLQGGMAKLAGKLGSMFAKKDLYAPSPRPTPIHGLRGTDTGGGEVGPRFSDWGNPDAGLFSKPACVTETFNKEPTDIDLNQVSSPAECYHTSWLAHRMTSMISPKDQMYGKPYYGKAQGSLNAFNKLLHPPRVGLPRFAEAAGAAAARNEGATAPATVRPELALLQASASGSRAKAEARAGRHAAAARRDLPRMAESRAAAETEAAMEVAPMLGNARAALSSQAGADAPGLNSASPLEKLREAVRPMPHYCRKMDNGLCRQRLRAPTPWQIRRKFRRMMMQSRIYALATKWRWALQRMCTSMPPIGQPRPPAMEGGGTWSGTSGAGGNPMQKLKRTAGKVRSLLSKLNVGGTQGIATKVQGAGPSGGLDAMLRNVDKSKESGYDGPKPPPRLQSEGMASNGKVETQPFTGFVKEPTPFGDHPAVGQMMDLGLPPMVAEQCSRLSRKVGAIADMYLHGYDLEEACTEAKMCKPAAFGITTEGAGTSLKSRLFSASMG